MALRLLGEPAATADSVVCSRARAVIERLGGVGSANPWTPLYLGVLGVVPWKLVKKIPIEPLLLPSWSELSIEHFAYWVKVICPPMMLVGAVGPGAPVEEAAALRRELRVPESGSLSSGAPSLAAQVIDRIAALATRYPVPFIRKRAIRAALERSEAFTEAHGDGGGKT